MLTGPLTLADNMFNKFQLGSALLLPFLFFQVSSSSSLWTAFEAIEHIVQTWNLNKLSVHNCPLNITEHRKLFKNEEDRTVLLQTKKEPTLQSATAIVCVMNPVTYPGPVLHHEMGVRFPVFCMVQNSNAMREILESIRPRLNQEIYFLQLDGLQLVESYQIKGKLITWPLGGLGRTLLLPSVLKRRADFQNISLPIVLSAQEPNIMYPNEEEGSYALKLKHIGTQNLFFPLFVVQFGQVFLFY